MEPLTARRPLILLGALALVALAAGCTSGPPGARPTLPASRVVFEPGGTVVVAVPSLPTNFNPSSPEGANRITAEVMEQVWPQSFVTDAGMATTTDPGFLEAAEVVSVSPFTVAYTLNPKAVWSDGVPIGLADFVYNWQEQLRWGPDLPDPGLAAGYRAISSITSSNGGSTIEVTFSHPYTEWEALFSDLVPAHIGERYGWVSAFQGFNRARVVSGGPFEITSYTPGVRLVLSRNPRYWSTPAGVAHIVLKVVPSAQALSQVEAGLVDIAQVPTGAAADAAVASAARAGIALSRSVVEVPTLWQLCFNTTAPIVSSLPFRTGIQHSLDPDEVTADSVGLSDAAVQPAADRLGLGLGSLLPPPSSGAGSSPGSPGSSAPAGAGGYDLAAAMTSFRSAGYVSSPGGELEAAATGLQVSLPLLVPSGNQLMAQAAAVIQAELSAVGIRVVLRSVPLASMLQSYLPTGRYVMALAPFLLTTFPGVELPVYSGSVLPVSAQPEMGPEAGGLGVRVGEAEGAENTGTAGAGAGSTAGGSPAGGTAAGVGSEPGAVAGGVVTRDVFGLDDPVVSADLNQALTNLNPTDDESLVAAADAQLWTDLPTIPLFQQPADLLHRSDVRAVSESPTWAGVFWDAEDWVIQLSPPVVPTLVPPGS